jgi:hypothetical protein
MHASMFLTQLPIDVTEHVTQYLDLRSTTALVSTTRESKSATGMDEENLDTIM